MLVFGVIAAVAGVAVILRYFQIRDDVPPMQRHARALDALRDLSEHPRPARDLAVQPEPPIDHVRILGEMPAGTRRSRRTSTARTATRNRRTGRSRAAAAAERPTIQIRASAGARARPESAAIRSASDPTVRDPGRAEPEPGGPEPAPPAPGLHAPALHAPALPRPALQTRGVHPRWAAVSARGYAVAAAAAVAVVALIVTLGIAIGSGGKGASSGATPTTVPARTTPASVVTTTAPRTTVPAVVTPVVALTPNGGTVTVRGSFRLTLRANGTCWVQITDSTGTSLFAATMHAGQSQDIPVSRSVTVRLGYTPAMTMSVNGVAINAGALAQTANVDFRTT